MTRALAVLYYYLVPDFIASKITLFELFKGDYFTPARVPRSSFSVDTTMRGDARMILASEWCYWVCSPIFVSLPCAEQVLDLRMLFLRARSINSETIKQTQDSKLQRSQIGRQIIGHHLWDAGVDIVVWLGFSVKVVLRVDHHEPILLHYYTN